MPIWSIIALQIAISAASLVVEIVAGRMLAPHVGMSLYTWTSVIAVVLAGFSAGHWWGGRLADKPATIALSRTGWLILAAALTTGLAGTLLARAASPVLSMVGHPVWGIVALTIAVFFLPSLFAGVPAPVLAREATRTSDTPGRSLGALFAAGAVGAIAGTLLAGFVFISWLGSTLTLVLISLTYALCGLALLRAAGTAGTRALIAALVCVAAATSALAAAPACTSETRYFCVRVIDVSADADSPANMMVIDHLVHGIGARDAPEVMFTDHAAMLDALARIRMGRDDFSSFFIGGGTFSIPRAWSSRGIGPVTVAEIDPQIVRIAARDFWFDPTTTRIFAEDARRALLDRPDTYDVIIGDAFTDIAVPPHLITREFFALVRMRLEPDGAFLMNVIDFEDRLYVLGAIYRTLAQVFPNVEIWTQQERPEPGARMVFVLVADDTPTPVDNFRVAAPDQTLFGALAPGFAQQIAGRGDLILTDDFAPIDRLMGRTD